MNDYDTRVVQRAGLRPERISTKSVSSNIATYGTNDDDAFFRICSTKLYNTVSGGGGGGGGYDDVLLRTTTVSAVCRHDDLYIIDRVVLLRIPKTSPRPGDVHVTVAEVYLVDCFRAGRRRATNATDVQPCAPRSASTVTAAAAAAAAVTMQNPFVTCGVTPRDGNARVCEARARDGLARSYRRTTMSSSYTVSACTWSADTTKATTRFSRPDDANKKKTGYTAAVQLLLFQYPQTRQPRPADTPWPTVYNLIVNE